MVRGHCARSRGIFVVLVLVVVLLSTVALFAQDWTHLTPATSPSPRSFTAMAPFGDGSEVVLFGGEINVLPGITGDTWIWGGSNWKQFLTTNPTPPAREGGMMAYDPVSGNAVLFGGVGGPNVYLSDTWLFGPKLGWRKVTTSIAPPPRAFGSMAYDPARLRVILNGGETTNQVSISDTWEFNPATNTWAQAHVKGSAPGYLSAMAQCSSSGLVMELFQDTTYLDEIVSGADGVWEPFVRTSPPHHREHGMAFYPVSGLDVLYGGLSCTFCTEVTDTWVGRCSSNAVDWLQKFPAHNPGPRWDHAMATGPNGLTVLLFGGYNGSFLNDTWVWGLRAACLPLDGSEIPRNSKVTCQFTPAEDLQFGRWEAFGFAPPLRHDFDATFEAVHPGPATITATWSDADGNHSQTLHYTIAGPH